VPLRDDLLNPIPGENPSGVSLRHDRIYDQIKEARTQENENIPSGEWQRTAKRADYPLVIKLAGEAIATKSKDLQLAAWLTEAQVRREGVALIQPCFRLMQDLQEQFWDTLHPEIEDGDAGMRAVPIEWAANRVAEFLIEGPVTRDGLKYYQYKDSRTIPAEADVGYDEAKTARREQALKDGKPTPEEFDKAFSATPKSFYVNLDATVRSAKETIDSLEAFCEEKYGSDGPAFGQLRNGLDEFGQVIASLLAEKRKSEPDPVEETATEALDQDAETEEGTDVPAAIGGRKIKPIPAFAMKNRDVVSAKPTDWDDAVNRIRECAQFIQEERPASPTAYLLQAVVQLGEMRVQDDLAREMIRQGQLAQAIQLLLRDAAQQSNGRARFQRKLHIAQLCIDASERKVAHLVLEELVKEIEDRKLEEWEAGEMIAQPLALLLKCLDPDDTSRREELFSRLCRIDPITALNVSH